MVHSQHHNRTEEAWPWNCTRCGTTIYHDAPTCRECDRTERAAEGDSPGGWPALVADAAAWIHRQSYPALVGKVGVIAGIELLLTTLWMVLFWGAPALPGVLAG